MSLNEQIRRVAVNEVLEPTFELTMQFLQVNAVATSEGIPIIEDIIIDEEERTASVFFPIVDEKFYFVIYLDIDPIVSVRFVGMSAGSIVELIVASNTLSLSDLLAILKIEPVQTWEKGQPRSGKGAPYEDSGFTFNPSRKRTGEVEDKLKAIMLLLTPLKDKLAQLSNIATACISIAYYGYKDQMWGIHLDRELLQDISDLHLSIDIDLYAGGPDLK